MGEWLLDSLAPGSGPLSPEEASGMMKILFPHGEVSTADFRRYCVEPAVELRQLVWEQLYTLDAEYRQYEERLDFELLPELD